MFKKPGFKQSFIKKFKRILLVLYKKACSASATVLRSLYRSVKRVHKVLAPYINAFKRSVINKSDEFGEIIYKYGVMIFDMDPDQIEEGFNEPSYIVETNARYMDKNAVWEFKSVQSQHQGIRFNSLRYSRLLAFKALDHLKSIISKAGLSFNAASMLLGRLTVSGNEMPSKNILVQQQKETNHISFINAVKLFVNRVGKGLSYHKSNSFSNNWFQTNSYLWKSVSLAVLEKGEEHFRYKRE